MRHCSNFSDESLKVLILLTKKEISNSKEQSTREKIRNEFPDVTFVAITFEEICKIVEGLFKEYEYKIEPVIEDYVAYCNDAGLFDQSKYLLKIVTCNQSLALNKKFGIYYHPSDRGYSKHRFIGIYAHKEVQAILEIDSVFDIKFNEQKDPALKKELIKGTQTDKYDQRIINIIKNAKKNIDHDIRNHHRFFCGPIQEVSYKKTSKYGIQGSRMVNLKTELQSLKL